MQNDINIITYIDKRLQEQPHESIWITNNNQEISIDLGYVQQWWDACMKPEIVDKISKINEIYPVSKEELEGAMKKCGMI